MDKFGQLRIYVSSIYISIFKEVTKRQLFTQNSEFFMFCTLIGYEINERTPVEKRHELCQALTLSNYDRIALETLYLQENESITHMKDVIRLAETYANSGMQHLLNDSLKEYTYEDQDGNWHLKPDSTDEIQLALFDYVLAEHESVPF